MQFTYEEIAYDTQDMVALRFDDVTLFLSKDGQRGFVAQMDGEHHLIIRRADRHELEKFAERTDDTFLRAIVKEPEPEGAD